jgi:GAF domain-containing protein
LLARFERSTAERERNDGLRREERLLSSISTQRELNPSLGLPRLLERVIGSVLELSETDRGVVLLRGDDGAMEIAARCNLTDPEIESAGFSGSVGAIERALSTARPVAVSDTLADPFLKERESVIGGGIRSLICVPLVAAGRLIGMIYADSRTPGASFDELDVQILESLAAHAALAIVTARVDRELKAMTAKLHASTGWARILAQHRARAAEGS